MYNSILSDGHFDRFPFETEEEFASACTEIVKRTADALNKNNSSAAVAESLTGGIVSSEIVRVSGSSRWFREGCVTYTDAAKINRLGVDPETLKAHTAVSMPAAMQMAEGERNASGADIAVATTGLAGPGADVLGRGAGLVFIAGANKNGVAAKRLALSGSRLRIRQCAAYCALLLMLALAEQE